MYKKTAKMRSIYPLLLLTLILSCKKKLDNFNPPQNPVINFKTDNFVGQYKNQGDNLDNSIFPFTSFIIVNVDKVKDNDLSIKILSSCPQTSEFVLKATAKSDSTFEINPQTVNSLDITGEGRISNQILSFRIKNSEKVLLDYIGSKTSEVLNPQLLKIVNLNNISGVENDSIILLGSGFSELKNHNIITFDGQKAEIIIATKDLLMFKVPERKAKTVKLVISVDSCQSVATTFEYQNDTWRPIAATLPRDGRWYATSFSIGNKGYICMGINQFRNRLLDLWEFDAETQEWSKKADFIGSARNASVAFVIDGIVYLGTGHNGIEGTNDFFKYNPNTNEWKQIADLPGARREHAIGFTLNGKGYVGTGKGKSGWFKDLWEYDPKTNKWIQKSNVPGPDRAFSVVYTHNNKAYIGGGFDGETDKGWLGDWYEYDPTTDKFTPKANFNARNPYVFQTNNKGYLLYDDATNLATYDFINDKWTNLNKPFEKLTLHGATFSLDSHAYFGTGFSGEYKTTFWRYIP